MSKKIAQKEEIATMKITRRTLLKTCLGTASLMALPAMQVHAGSSASQAGCIPQDASIVSGYCPFCQVRCTYEARVKDGKVLSIIGKKIIGGLVELCALKVFLFWSLSKALTGLPNQCYEQNTAGKTLRTMKRYI